MRGAAGCQRRQRKCKPYGQAQLQPFVTVDVIELALHDLQVTDDQPRLGERELVSRVDCWKDHIPKGSDRALQAQPCRRRHSLERPGANMRPTFAA